MTELEAQLLSMLEAEKRENEREREEVAKEREEVAKEREALRSMLLSLSEQQKRIIELLSKPMEGDSLEITLKKSLDNFQVRLMQSLMQLLNEQKS